MNRQWSYGCGGKNDGIYQRMAFVKSKGYLNGDNMPQMSLYNSGDCAFMAAGFSKKISTLSAQHSWKLRRA